MRRFDLCVIGSGPAGQRCAIQASKLGKRVVVVDATAAVGGVAIHTGTIPSKALREAVLSACGSARTGVRLSDPTSCASFTLKGLWQACRPIIDAEVELVRRHFASNGIDMVDGMARFTAADSIEVVSSRGVEALAADHVMIAVGTRPAKPASITFDDQNVLTSDDLLKLDELPHSMIIVGGGVIGTEYASMFAAVGVKVTLVESKNRLLEFVDSEIAEALQYRLRQAGVTLRCGEKVVSITTIDAPVGSRSRDGRMAEAQLESGKTLRADCLCYCIGRQGATDGLNLAAAGLEADSRGRISVDANYRTKVPTIFAAGDVIGFPALASTSMEQGRIAACAMFGERADAISPLLPYGIYAIPEISMVGWTEDRLTAEGIPYETGVASYGETARGQLLGDTDGMLKLLIHQESHTILGVHIIGTDATELVHIGQVAMAFKATVEHFVDTVFNYPTLAECYKVAALNGINKLRGV